MDKICFKYIGPVEYQQFLGLLRRQIGKACSPEVLASFEQDAKETQTFADLYEVAQRYVEFYDTQVAFFKECGVID